MKFMKVIWPKEGILKVMERKNWQGEPTTDEAQQNSEHISGGDEQTNDENNNLSAGKQEHIYKRVYANADGLET